MKGYMYLIHVGRLLTLHSAKNNPKGGPSIYTDNIPAFLLTRSNLLVPLSYAAYTN